ncbi:hypothetical protein, partial [Prevotella sp. CAG:592]|uniref:hypothetical protein n=1 Tax=Prevotella sp. CAG:592 TaxID=1262931 RepID=UPI00258A9077
YSCFQDSANASNSRRLNSLHLTIPFASKNHPDNWLTIARWSTACLSEHYSEKPDGLTVFSQFLILLRISDIGNFYSYYFRKIMA